MCSGHVKVSGIQGDIVKRVLIILAMFAVLGGRVVLSQEEGVNFVRNPGFEEVDDKGSPVAWRINRDVYRVVDGAGRNGGRALVYENDNPDRYVVPSQTLDVEPGYCYAYQVWVRTEDLRGNENGATICMQWSNNGKFVGGDYTPGIRDNNSEWVLVRGVTGKVPTNVTSISVSPYVRRGMQGKAWFDDIRVEKFLPPMVKSVSVSTYRSYVVAGSFAINAALSPESADDNLRGFSGEFIIRSSDGGFNLKRKADELTNSRATLEMDSTLLLEGRYDVSFVLYDGDGRERGRAVTQLKRVNRMPERRSYIDKHNRLIHEGKPFFPLGMYFSGVNKGDLEIYAKSDFNVIMPYGAPDKERMDLCESMGIKVIYSVKDIYTGTSYVPKNIKSEADEISFVERKVAEFGKHPALLAWYINDELPLSMVERLAARRDLMERLDPHHPTWVVLYQVDQVAQYMPTFDVIGTDPYPIPTKSAGLALEWTRMTRDGVLNTRAMWQVPQAFDWGGYNKSNLEATRAPTVDEVRAMSWQCIAAGANGLVMYSFFDLKKMSERDPFERRWAEVCQVAKQISTYIPVLLSVEPVPEMEVKAPGSVEIRAWRKGEELYLLAVNGADESVAASVHLGVDYSTILSEFGHKPTREESGELRFKLAPLDPVMVRLKL